MSTASLARQSVVEVASGSVLIRNANTTIGYCRFTQIGDIEYIFVNPMYRRSGYGRRLLDEVRNTTVEFDGSRQALQALIGFATIDSDEIDANGDRLFFDEECFLRAVPGAGRFQIDTLAPVAGRGVIVGSKANGAELATPAIDADALAARIRFVWESRTPCPVAAAAATGGSLLEPHVVLD